MYVCVHIESWQQQINTPIQLYHMSACQDKNLPPDSSTFKQLNTEETRRVYTITSSRAYIKQSNKVEKLQKLRWFTKKPRHQWALYLSACSPATWHLQSSLLCHQLPWIPGANWLNEWPTIMLSIDMSCIFFRKIVCDLFKQSWCCFFQNTK